MPQVSVIVATRDRAEWLRRALASLEAQDMPPEQVEVLVVDNGSSDETAQVIADFDARMPNLRGLVEPEPNLSLARNCGVAEARGEVLAFLDDDARADRDWVRAMAAAFERHPDVGAVGGRIELVWPDGPPAWISPEIASLYAELDVGPSESDFVFPLMPFGANFGVRSEALDRVGAFSPRLGRVGRGLISGDEGELCWRIAAAGSRLLYDPAVRVKHDVQPDRTRLGWALKRSWDQGRTRAIASGLRGLRRSRRDWLGLLLRSAGQTVSMAGRALLSAIMLRPRRRSTTALVYAVMTLGCATEALRALRDPAHYAAQR